MRPGSRATSPRGARRWRATTPTSSTGRRSAPPWTGAGGGLVTTAADLARYVRGLWSARIIDSRGLNELTRWTSGASFPPDSGLRYERYGVGMGSNVVEGVELLGHTGFIGAFAFYAPECDAVLVGTHNASHVDRWPLVAALCRELREVR